MGIAQWVIGCQCKERSATKITIRIYIDNYNFANEFLVEMTLDMVSCMTMLGALLLILLTMSIIIVNISSACYILNSHISINRINNSKCYIEYWKLKFTILRREIL
jgi:hypothetical protein